VSPDDSASLVHSSTDELNSADLVDLDWFARVIFSQYDLVGVGPDIGWLAIFKCKHDH
jgi:hypothetical protein